MPETPFQTLGRYRLFEEIGRGGFSIVYRADRPPLLSALALKLLDPGLFADDPHMIERFIQEARGVANLDHPRIVNMIDLEQTDGRVFMVMEYQPGGSLKKWLEDHPDATLRQVAALIRDIAEALDFAHTSGVVHGDIKPANVLLDREGRAKLADFGLLRVIGGSTTISRDMAQGTPFYMSPEQSRGQLTALSDQYSLAVVAFELLGGRVPFSGQITSEVIIKLRSEVPPSLAGLNSRVSPAMEATVNRALAKEPQERFKSCGEFARALSAAVEAAVEANRLEIGARIESALQARDLPAARAALAELRTLEPGDTRLAGWEEQASRLEQSTLAYTAAVENLNAALAGAQKLSQADPAATKDLPPGLIAPPRPSPCELARRWRLALFTLGALVGLAILIGLGTLIFAAGGQPQRDSVVAILRSLTPVPPTLTPSLTSTLSPIPTFTNTPSRTPSLIPTSTLTSTGTPTRVVIDATSATKISIVGALTGHSKNILSLAYSPDSKILASSDEDGTIILWDTEFNKIISSIKNDANFSKILFLKDGKTLVASGSDIRFFNITTGKQINQFDFKPSDMDYDPVNDRLAALSGKTVRVWPTTNVSALTNYYDYTLPGKTSDSYDRLFFSQDTNLLAVTYKLYNPNGADYYYISIVDLSKKDSAHYINYNQLFFGRFIPVHNYLAASYRSVKGYYEIMILDTSNLDPNNLALVKTKTILTSSLVYKCENNINLKTNLDGSLLASYCFIRRPDSLDNEYQIVLWNMDTLTELRWLLNSKTPRGDFTFSPNGIWIAVANGNEIVLYGLHVWNAPTLTAQALSATPTQTLSPTLTFTLTHSVTPTPSRTVVPSPTNLPSPVP